MGTLNYPRLLWPIVIRKGVTQLWPSQMTSECTEIPDTVRPISTTPAPSSPKENPMFEGDEMIVVDLTADDPAAAAADPSRQGRDPGPLPPPETTKAMIVCVGEGEPTRHHFVGREVAEDVFLGARSRRHNLIFRCERCLACRVWGNEAVGGESSAEGSA